MKHFLDNTIYLMEEQTSELNNVICEELTINNSVTELLKKISEKFTEEFSKKSFERVRNFSYKKIEFTYYCFNTIVKFVFNCYNAFNAFEYENLKKSFSIGNGQTNETQKIITINLGFISGTQQTPCIDVLRHEEHHIFQMCKQKDINNWGKGKKGKDVYLKASEILQDNNSNNNDFIVSFLIYTQSPNEVDAFVNQLYEQLVASNFGDEIKTISKSQVYSYYLTSKKYLNIIINNRIRFEKIINDFGWKYNTFVKIIQKALKRTINKIGKVIIKFYKDYPQRKPTEICFNNLTDKIKNYE